MKPRIAALATAVGVLAASGGAIAVAGTDQSAPGGAAQAQYCPTDCTTTPTTTTTAPVVTTVPVTTTVAPAPVVTPTTTSTTSTTPTVVPVNGPPTTGNVTVTTVGAAGGNVKAAVSGASVGVHFGKNAVPAGTQVSIAKSNPAAVRRALPASMKGAKIVDAIALGIVHGGAAVKMSKPATVTLADNDVARGDVVAVFNARTGKYQVVAKVTSSKGVVTLRLTAGESIVVLRKSAH